MGLGTAAFWKKLAAVSCSQMTTGKVGSDWGLGQRASWALHGSVRGIGAWVLGKVWMVMARRLLVWS